MKKAGLALLGLGMLLPTVAGAQAINAQEGFYIGAGGGAAWFIGSNPDRLVGQAQDLVRGIRPRDLRQSEGLRERIAGDLARVGRQLETLLVDRPRRRIVRTGVDAPGEAVVA